MFKKALSLTLCVVLLFICTTVSFAKLHTHYSILDFDEIGGYRGDYVLLYNPDTDNEKMSTGTLNGLIDTSVGGRSMSIDIGNELQKAPILPHIPRSNAGQVEQNDNNSNKTTPPRIGETRLYYVYNFESGEMDECETRLSAVGNNCYVWEGVNSIDFPLTQYSDSAIQTLKKTFDDAYLTMIDSFGSFCDPEGFGKVNIVLYNVIGDGVAGYFNPNDLYGMNDAAAIYLDTYPSIVTQNADNTFTAQIDIFTKSALIHEFQHLIFESHTGGKDAGESGEWLNEALSTAAQEIVFPGSATCSFIPWWSENALSWKRDSSDNWTLEVPNEYATDIKSLCGGGMYGDEMLGNEVYYNYARVTMFGQYLYSQAGSNSVFKKIIDAIEAGNDDMRAIELAMRGTRLDGMSISEIVLCFRTACIVNDSSSYNGKYGFILQNGYKPLKSLYSLKNPYDTISIGVFTEESTTIRPGGFAVIKTINGVYSPPNDADPDLQYVGITVNNLRNLAIGDINADSRVNTGDAALMLRYCIGLYEFSDVQYNASDINSDGRRNTGDVVAILRSCVGQK